MRVRDNELYDFIADFGRRNRQTTEPRLLAVLKSRFYGREDARQLLYRLEHLGLIYTTEETIELRRLRR